MLKSSIIKLVSAVDAFFLRARDRKVAPPLEHEEEVVPEQDDRCLRPGQAVFCRLSDTSHTHGKIVGFTRLAGNGGTTYALVDVPGSICALPIDVDLIFLQEEPASEPDPEPDAAKAN